MSYDNITHPPPAYVTDETIFICGGGGEYVLGGGEAGQVPHDILGWGVSPPKYCDTTETGSRESLSERFLTQQEKYA